MFKKNEKQTENVKEKKVRTVKVGTHKKTVIALWVVLIASVSFGVYKNFTAIDQHTTHEVETIQLRNHGFLMCAYLDSTHLFFFWFFDSFCLFLILLKHIFQVLSVLS